MKQEKLLKNELPRYRDRLRANLEINSMVYKFGLWLKKINKRKENEIKKKK